MSDTPTNARYVLRVWPTWPLRSRLLRPTPKPKQASGKRARADSMNGQGSAQPTGAVEINSVTDGSVCECGCGGTDD